MSEMTFSFVDVDGSTLPDSAIVADGDGDAAKPVVVLVHGLSGDRRDFSDPAAHPGRPHLDHAAPYPPPQDAGWHWFPGLFFIGSLELDPPKVIRSWQQFLSERGFRSVTYAQVDNDGLAARPLLQLEGLVRALMTTYPNAKLAFVAHSRGGILVRMLLKANAGDPALRGRVVAVVTLNTPHQGTDLASLAVALNAAIANVRSSHPIVDAVLAPIAAEANSAAYQEIRTDSPFLGELANGETAFEGARYYTFGGTSVRYSRVNWWTTTLESSIPQWTYPPYHWTIFESELPFDSPLLDILPDLTLELTQGAGDGLVADARSRLPFAVHESLRLNHAEPLWDTALQQRVLGLLEPRRGRFVSQTAPDALSPGQQFEATVTMQNVGSMTWRAEDGHRLASLAEGNWGIERVAPSGPIPPDEEAVFRFSITAPTAPGTYDFRWRMLQEGIGWFGDATPFVSVRVGATEEVDCGALVAAITEATDAIAGLEADLQAAATGERAGIIEQIEWWRGALTEREQRARASGCLT